MLLLELTPDHGRHRGDEQALLGCPGPRTADVFMTHHTDHLPALTHSHVQQREIGRASCRKECGSTLRFRLSPCHYKKNHNNNKAERLSTLLAKKRRRRN